MLCQDEKSFLFGLRLVLDNLISDLVEEGPAASCTESWRDNACGISVYAVVDRAGVRGIEGGFFEDGKVLALSPVSVPVAKATGNSLATFTTPDTAPSLVRHINTHVGTER